MSFLKTDLKYDHYYWTPTNDPGVFTGAPSRRLFDRFNGEQVLFIINLYAGILGKFTINEGREMEHLINSSLPLEAKSEISVLNWLTNAYPKSN